MKLNNVIKYLGCGLIGATVMTVILVPSLRCGGNGVKIPEKSILNYDGKSIYKKFLLLDSNGWSFTFGAEKVRIGFAGFGDAGDESTIQFTFIGAERKTIDKGHEQFAIDRTSAFDINVCGNANSVMDWTSNISDGFTELPTTGYNGHKYYYANLGDNVFGGVDPGPLHFFNLGELKKEKPFYTFIQHCLILDDLPPRAS